MAGQNTYTNRRCQGILALTAEQIRGNGWLQRVPALSRRVGRQAA